MDNLNSIIFVYAKEGKIKVIDHSTALQISGSLIKEGWKHTATLDVCRFLENLVNVAEPEDVIESLNELVK